MYKRQEYDNIYIVDSRSATLGLQLLVRRAVQRVAEGFSAMAVSYTHLDVYKRQAEEQLDEGRAELEDAQAQLDSAKSQIASGEKDLQAIKEILPGTLTPVSYTHLDVYKRQGRPSLPRFSSITRKPSYKGDISRIASS